MSSPYDVLGLKVEDATDATVRAAYLGLTRAFPPEQHPQHAAAVRRAYEAVKDFESRVRYHLLEAGAEATLETVLEQVACQTPRRRWTLAELLDASRTT